jgi:DNA sulfur modification protein DndD
MFIKTIQLRNWKSYADVSFDFDTYSNKRNVVLVNANNGYGKTSLLEAVILGLFGKSGLHLVGRAHNEESADAVSYNEFLQRALHVPAQEQGINSSASVKIVFDGNDLEERITIQRVWYFAGNGRFKEEELRISTGRDDEILSVPPIDSKEDYYRGFIAQHFLTPHLAQFFLFDGEQVQKLARKDMASQVKIGIEGILGIPTLSALATSLHDYAKKQKGKSIGDDKIDAIRNELTEVEDLKTSKDKQLSSVVEKLAPLQEKRDRLHKEFASLFGGSHASVREESEEKGKLEKQEAKLKQQLEDLLKSKIAVALVGTDLRKKAMRTLEAEAKREKWELSKKHGNDNYSKFVALLESSKPDFSPELSEKQKSILNEKLEKAWEDIWYPPPEGTADEFLHTFLNASDRLMTIEALKQIDSLAINQIGELLDALAKIRVDVQKINVRIAQISGVDDKVSKIASDQKALSDEISTLEVTRKTLERELEDLKGQISSKRQDLGKYEKIIENAEPQIKKSLMADKLAFVIQDIIAEAFPHHVADLAEEMTAAYKKMAHKKIVKKILIDSECVVQLQSDNGRDVRGMDASAGENQIFALALIAAIAKVSGRNFPIIMDTPLARLDPDHRRNVLKYFTDSKSQVILLSQPSEVYGEYLDLIEPKISKQFVIEHEQITSTVGRSNVRELTGLDEAAA